MESVVLNQNLRLTPKGIAFKNVSSPVEQPSANTSVTLHPQVQPQVAAPIQMQYPLQQDMFMTYPVQEKKKMSTGAKIALVTGIVGLTALTFVVMKKVGKIDVSDEFSKLFGMKGKNPISSEEVNKLKNEFVDLSQDKSIVSLSDESIDPNFRKWAQGVVQALKSPQELKDFTAHSQIPNSYYMSGPTGVGKTYNADVILKELGAKRIKRTYDDFGSKWVSEGSGNIKRFFDAVDAMLKANPNERFGIVFDEFDALVTAVDQAAEKHYLKEERQAILNGIDKIRKNPNVFILTSSNLDAASDKVDKAVLRRLGTTMQLDYPTPKALLASLKTQFGKMGESLNIKLFESKESEMASFIEKLYKEKGGKIGHGDIENIVNMTVNKFENAVLKEAISRGIAKDGATKVRVLDRAKFNDLMREKAEDIIKYMDEAAEGLGRFAGEKANNGGRKIGF